MTARVTRQIMRAAARVSMRYIVVAGLDTCSWPTSHWPFAFWKHVVTRTQ